MSLCSRTCFFQTTAHTEWALNTAWVYIHSLDPSQRAVRSSNNQTHIKTTSCVAPPTDSRLKNPTSYANMSDSESSSASNGAKVLTYRYNGQMMYVKAASTFEIAAQRARATYPDLADVPTARMSFYVTASIKKGQQTRVRISPSAWSPIMSTLPAYEILEIELTEPAALVAVYAPPQYGSESTAPLEASECDTSKVITYRFGEELAFVQVAPTLEAAGDIARDTFQELAQVPSESILFYVSVRVRENPGRVGISSSAWADVTAGLPQCEIMDVEIARPRSREPLPSSKPCLFEADAPPGYDDAGSSSRYLDAKDSRGRSNDTPQTAERPRSPGLMHKTKSFFSGKKP